MSKEFLMMTPIGARHLPIPDGAILLTTDENPYGLAPLEWSNALARVLRA